MWPLAAAGVPVRDRLTDTPATEQTGGVQLTEPTTVIDAAQTTATAVYRSARATDDRFGPSVVGTASNKRPAQSGAHYGIGRLIWMWLPRCSEGRIVSVKADSLLPGKCIAGESGVE